MATTLWSDDGTGTAAANWASNTPQVGQAVSYVDGVYVQWYSNGGTAWQPDVGSSGHLEFAKLNIAGSPGNDQSLTSDLLYGLPNSHDYLIIRSDATFQNFYALWVDSNNGRIGLVERVAGVDTLVGGSFFAVALGSGVWKAAKIDAIGTTVRIFHDGSELYSATLTSRSGGIAAVGHSALAGQSGTSPMLYKNIVWVDETAGGVGAALAGALTADASTSAALSVEKPLAASVSGSGVVAAALSVEKPLAASVNGSGVVAAALDVEKPLAGALTADASTAAALSVEKPLAGALTADASTSATLGVEKLFAGALTADASTSAALSVEKPLAASLAVVSSASGALEALGFAATISTGVSAGGALTIEKPLAASVGSSSTTTGALTIEKPLAASVQLSVTSTAALLVEHGLQAALTSTATVSASLETLPDLLWPAGIFRPLARPRTMPGRRTTTPMLFHAAVTAEAGAALAASVTARATSSGDLTNPSTALAATLTVGAVASATLGVTHSLAASVAITATARAALGYDHGLLARLTVYDTAVVLTPYAGTPQVRTYATAPQHDVLTTPTRLRPYP